MPPSMPVYYTVDGRDPRPVPSTGMFGSMGKQSSASSRDEAVKKAKESGISVPGKTIWGADVNPNGMQGYFVRYQNGGKRRKTRRGRKTRRNKSRKSRGKK